MAKDHSYSERGNPLPPPHGLLFPISNKGGLVYASSHRQDTTYHNIFCISRGALAGTRNSSMGSIRLPTSVIETKGKKYTQLIWKIEEEFIALGLQAFEHSQKTINNTFFRKLLYNGQTRTK